MKIICNKNKLNYRSNIAIAINQSVEMDSLTVSFHNMSFMSITAEVVRTYGKALCRCLLETKQNDHNKYKYNSPTF